MQQTTNSPDVSPRSLLPTGENRAKLRRWRSIKDKISQYGIAFAGISVVAAFATIFVYLFSEVGPIFSSASIEKQQSFNSVAAKPIFTNLERYGEVGLVIDAEGLMQFFDAKTGAMTQQVKLPIPLDAKITSFAKGEPRSGIIAVGLSNGHALVAKHEYNLSYPNDQRKIVPVVSYPLGETPIALNPTGQPILSLAVQEGSSGTAITAFTADGHLSLNLFEAQTEFLTGETTFVRQD